jgi:hypothetical protein
MPEDIQERLHADTPRDQRNLFLWGWLALVALYNLFVIISLLSGGADPNLGYVVGELPTSGAGIWIGVIGRAAIILFAVITALGYKLGWYGLAAAYVVSLIGSLAAGFNIGALLETGLVLFVVWLLLRGDWHRMK